MSIDHDERAGRLWPILTQLAARQETTTYGRASELIGIHHRAMRHALAPIQSYCLGNGIPPLTALVVSSRTNIQGNGYIAGDAGDRTDLARVFEFDWSNVINPFPSLPADEIDRLSEELRKNPDKAADILALVPVRGDAQRLFRKTLLLAYEHKCAICGLSFVDALEAAHIVPWSDGQPEARIDPRNGLLLCANHHSLFDADLLTVDQKYKVTYYDPDKIDGPYTEADQIVTVDHHGRQITLPQDKRLHPSRHYLRQRQQQS